MVAIHQQANNLCKGRPSMAHWLLIHGAASSRLTWTRQLPVLPYRTRVDLPDWPTVEPDRLLDRWADWCLTQLPEPSVIMGHSMGGAIAQLMALKNPQQVLGLVLVGTGPRLPVSPQLIDQLRTTPHEALANITRWSLKRQPDPVLLEKSLQQAQKVDPERALREFLVCQTFDVRDRLKTLHVPIVVIAGAEDRMTPAALTEEFRTIWPDIPYYVVPEAGHMMMLEAPEAFNQILTRIKDQYRW